MQPTEVIDPDSQEDRNRPEVVKQELEKVAKSVKDNFISLAELLYETWSNAYHKEYGYSNFGDFSASLDINPRKANWLVSITRTIHRLGIAWTNVEEIGWRKLGTISTVLDSNNYTEWLDEARNNPLPVLEEQVKAAKEGREEAETPVKMSLQLTEEENSITASAIEQAMNFDNVKTKGRALSIICYEWFQMQLDEE